MSLHPLVEQAAISVTFPEQAFYGRFGRQSQFDTLADAEGVAIRLVRAGDDPREATLDLQYGFLAEILAELADGLARRNTLDEAHCEALHDAARRLCAALERRARPA